MGRESGGGGSGAEASQNMEDIRFPNRLGACPGLVLALATSHRAHGYVACASRLGREAWQSLQSGAEHGSVRRR